MTEHHTPMLDDMIDAMHTFLHSVAVDGASSGELILIE